MRMLLVCITCSFFEIDLRSDFLIFSLVIISGCMDIIKTVQLPFYKGLEKIEPSPNLQLLNNFDNDFFRRKAHQQA